MVEKHFYCFVTQLFTCHSKTSEIIGGRFPPSPWCSRLGIKHLYHSYTECHYLNAISRGLCSVYCCDMYSTCIVYCCCFRRQTRTQLPHPYHLPRLYLWWTDLRMVSVRHLLTPPQSLKFAWKRQALAVMIDSR